MTAYGFFSSACCNVISFRDCWKISKDNCKPRVDRAIYSYSPPRVTSHEGVQTKTAYDFETSDAIV